MKMVADLVGFIILGLFVGGFVVTILFFLLGCLLDTTEVK